MKERWWLDADRRALIEERAPLGVAAWMHLPATVLSTDRQSAAVRIDGDPPLLVKWRRPLPRRRRRTFLRASRERREARACLRARALGIECPEPWAVGERRRAGVLLGSVLVRGFDSGARTVADAPEHLEELATNLRRWHDLGFRHGDCYPKNVLVGGAQSALQPIGCPAARFMKTGADPDPARMKDLAQLAAGWQALRPEDDPFALLDPYAREPGLPDKGTLLELVRPFYERVMARKARRLATRPQREPHGPPKPTPLALDAAAVPVVVRDIGEIFG